ncbi:Major facilitator superfamily domain-containing protein 8 [Nymphon striatum]|nr:Major facilitator superfamily domain-containing protein 8 [Nymphon striatum]
MLLNTKKRLTYICIAFSYLLTGLQYAIIFPSLNLFITTRYSASSTSLGIIIAAYSISGIFSGPIFGYIVDRKKNSKSVIFLGNISNIIGNVMYMLGISPLFLVFSRLICGIGSGAVSAMFADITRSSSAKELTSIISIMMGLQEVGLLFAPVFAIVLKDIHFYIGPFLIDKFTSPGLVMAILYGLLEMMIPFMYFNLTCLYEQKCIEDSMCYEDRDENTLINDSLSVKIESASNVSSNFRSVNDSMNNFYADDSQSFVTQTIDCPGQPTENDTLQLRIVSTSLDEVIVLLGLQFISAFSQTTLETIVTPLSRKLYDWSDVENAGFFLAAGVLILIMFLIINRVNRLMGDRYMILFGLVSMIISYIWLIAFFIPNSSPGSLKSLPYFVVGAFFDLMGLPVLMVCSTSLFTKLTSKETQAYSHGIRRSCLFIGFIVGPIWGGSAVHKMYLLFSLPLPDSSLGCLSLWRPSRMREAVLSYVVRGICIQRRTVLRPEWATTGGADAQQFLIHDSGAATHN